MEGFDIRLHALSKNASHLLRVRLGINGQGSLILPGQTFSRTMSNSFTEEEKSLMERHAGLTLPTMDECGRTFDVEVYSKNDTYFLRGPRGWKRLSFMNSYSKDTIVSLWVYRERRTVGSIFEVPRLIVMREEMDKFYCSECQRHCVHWE